MVRADDPQPVDFDRQVRPILSNTCYACHGPDEEQRESGLRLDIREDAIGPAESGKPAIVPGDPEHSTLVSRTHSTKNGIKMPPPESNKTLSDADKEILRRWVAEGAEYRQHWSFAPPRRAKLPVVKNQSWVRDPIDRFILAKLEAEGLTPSPEASKETLVRRLTLDLTGLPPTLEEIDAYLADDRPDAYENLVDRLLASPHFGERMAVDWLDAARFADTHGYHIDSGRDMTRWRAWVIDAYNANKPFDDFTVEQLAGDLLPNPTVGQLVASGFNRNHMINFEGGAVPEEYHTAYIVDRVNTTSTVWLGLTVACAQCHDHKFDPITQKEYYQLFAFFHNVPENGLDGSKGNAAPVIKVPTPEQQAAIDADRSETLEIESRLAGPWPELDEAQKAWEADHGAVVPTWAVVNPLEMKSAGGATLTVEPGGAISATGVNPANDTYTIRISGPIGGVTAVRLETLNDDSLKGKGPGRSVNGNIVMTDVRIALNGSNGASKPLKIAAASADFSQETFPIAYAIDDQPQTGWAIDPQEGTAHAAIFRLDEPIVPQGDSTLEITLDFQSIFASHQLGRFRLSLTRAENPTTDTIPVEIASALKVAADERNDAQRNMIRSFYRTAISIEGRTLESRRKALQETLRKLDESLPTAMVMREMPEPRDTFMLMRGEYDKKGEKVEAATPAALPPLPEGMPANRLGLARWLVDPSQPLTSRVVVNRIWQMFFGTGIVETSGDFGIQGALPSHPELLDWLAVEFMRPTDAAGESTGRRWDVKAIVRRMVLSSTYRQSSTVTPERLAADPEDRLLDRAPRLRLQAEFVRDQALAISGLLKHRIGGPSVSPYQPSGLWEELMSRSDGAAWSAQTYTQSHGDDLYRRTMYTFWKRTSPPPTLSTFDAPDREVCTVRRSRTNTPLQALVLMNDPTYVEASRHLAERIMGQKGASADDRISFAFRLATARTPSDEERSVLREFFEAELAHYRQHPDAAKELLSVGESPVNGALDPAELAAWTAVSSAILNLDETVTKG
jgi:hypothetical protein